MTLTIEGLCPLLQVFVTHYGMKQLYLKDPDGYGHCFQWKVP